MPPKHSAKRSRKAGPPAGAEPAPSADSAEPKGGEQSRTEPASLEQVHKLMWRPEADIEIPGVDVPKGTLAKHREKVVEEERHEIRIQSERLRQRREALDNVAPHPTEQEPKAFRAQTVADFIEELNTLKPQIYSEKDIQECRRRFPNFRVFEIVDKHPQLKLKLVNIQGHRRHYRFAQELAAALHGRQLSTIQADWKKHKPPKFRHQR